MAESLSGTLLLAVGAVAASALIADSVHEKKQAECPKVRVAAITTLHYRDVTVRLEDGRELTVNRAVLKPGDLICDPQPREKQQ